MKRVLCVAAFATACSFAFSANAGVGAAYRTRDPIACPSAAEQPKGAPNVQQATRIFRCSTEAISSHLYLTDHVDLQIGGARPFHYGDGYAEIDSSKAVYPIRGAWTQYQCISLKEYPAASAKNCSVFDESNASGVCYQTTFGDWRCRMHALSSVMRPDYVQGPQ